MRIIFSLLLVVLLTPPVHAAGDLVPFAGVQEECVQVGDITFGPGGRWASCHVTQGRWLATIDFMDLYQAQYCLGKNAETCEQRALVIFANRAYKPEAKALLVRIDDGAVKYDDPLVVISDGESVMAVSMHNPAGGVVNSYYLWRGGQWIAMDAQGWLHGLSAYLPDGASVRQAAWPDLETMSAQVNLFRTGDADCCPSGGMANVELGLVKEQFVVKRVKVHPMAK